MTSQATRKARPQFLPLLGLAAVAAGALVVRNKMRRAPAGSDRSHHARLRIPWTLLMVLSYTGLAFALVNYVLSDVASAEVNLYVAQPALWGSLAVLAGVCSWKTGTGRVFMGKMLLLAGWAAGFQIAAQVAIGILYGFGYSPYAREPLHMAENGLYLVTLVAGVEASRVYVLHSLRRHAEYLSLVFVSLVYAALLVPVVNYSALQSTGGAFQLAGATLLPAMSLSVLASYIALNGGGLAAFLYHGGIRAFEWFSPILPNVEWTVTAFLGTIVPLICAVSIRGALNAPAEAAREEAKPFDVSAPWIAAVMALVALLWFNTGLLGVTPSVVSGVSMEPNMHAGDLVLMRQMDPEDLKVGDVLQYRTANGDIFHRIIEIQPTNAGLVFVTQGDNNNIPDEPVLEGQVRGKIVLTIPKVGWVPITVGRVLNELR